MDDSYNNARKSSKYVFNSHPNSSKDKNVLNSYLSNKLLDVNVLLTLRSENQTDIQKIEEMLRDEEEVSGMFDEKNEIEIEEKMSTGFTNCAAMMKRSRTDGQGSSSQPQNTNNSRNTNLENSKQVDSESKNLMSKLESEIITSTTTTNWNDIAGLAETKRTIQEIVLWPVLHPEFFTGLREPPRGLLLFGPPGTGKTLIGKCIASQTKSTFFSISASSLTSKWMGEGEKTVKALFQMARERAPSVIFIDEIDAVLGKRKDDESEGGRKIKTEFLVQFDGIGNVNEPKMGDDDCENTDEEEKRKRFNKNRVLVIGATNRPDDLDEAVRRRLIKRIYVPLPDMEGRKTLLRNLLSEFMEDIDENGLELLCKELEGYSGSDLHGLCKEASMEPVREAMSEENIKTLRKVTFNDIRKGMKQIRKSVGDLGIYEKFNEAYGSG